MYPLINLSSDIQITFTPPFLLNGSTIERIEERENIIVFYSTGGEYYHSSINYFNDIFNEYIAKLRDIHERVRFSLEILLSSVEFFPKYENLHRFIDDIKLHCHQYKTNNIYQHFCQKYEYAFSSDIDTRRYGENAWLNPILSIDNIYNKVLYGEIGFLKTATAIPYIPKQILNDHTLIERNRGCRRILDMQRQSTRPNLDYIYLTSSSRGSAYRIPELQRTINIPRGTRPTFVLDEVNLNDIENAMQQMQIHLPPLSSSLQNEGAACEPQYIHRYDYVPEYIKYYMPNENPDTTLLLGAEIEVDIGGESEKNAKKGLEIICGIDESGKALEDKMYCTHDGSLMSGIEFDTMPCSFEYHKQNMRYKELFDFLDNAGYRAHDTTTCGLHIHANRDYLGKTEHMQQLVIAKILYIIEKFNDEICVIARRNTQFSRFAGNKNDSAITLFSKYTDSGKKVALNLEHKDTIEFRMFKGTLKHTTLLLTMEFVKCIIDYAKSINIENIELMQWEDLMNTFSNELKEYYNERLEMKSKS